MRVGGVSDRKFEDAAGLGGGWGGGNTRVWATILLLKATQKDREVGESSSDPGGACGPLSWPPGRCHLQRGWSLWLPSPQPAAARAAPSRPVRGPCDSVSPNVARRGERGTGLRPGALWRRSGRPLRSALPPLSLAKSLKALAHFVTPGASNHPVSISLTLFIQLKTHLKTLHPGVCSGLYPH